MRGFIVRRPKMRMETENETEQDEQTTEEQQRSEQPPQLKLRDLRPEKDPMGAGIPRLGPESF